mgnify:CR=1 FL=1
MGKPYSSVIRGAKGSAFTITGVNQLELKFDATKNADFAKRMLQAAEPHLMRALDEEMLRHPGPLQKSLKSTGPQQNAAGGWYLAYRATTGNERPSDSRKNPEKMIFLIQREYVKERKLKNGKIIKSYAIPADDVIGKAAEKSRDAVINAMQAAFDEELGRIWDE